MSNPIRPTGPTQANPLPQGQLLVYAAEDGRIKIDVRLENETVWLTQQHMADLFQTTKQNISLHLKNIFADNELVREATVKEFLTVQSEGSRSVNRRVTMHMGDWVSKLHGFLTINDRDILTHAGKISHDMAKDTAETEYEKFNQARIQQADAVDGEFEKAIKQLPPPPKPKKKGGKK